MEQLINEMIEHAKAIVDLQRKLFKWYGVRIYSTRIDGNCNLLPNIILQGDYGIPEIATIHGDEIQHTGEHHKFLYNGDINVEVCTVHHGNRLLKARKRNNKYTRQPSTKEV